MGFDPTFYRTFYQLNYPPLKRRLAADGRVVRRAAISKRRSIHDEYLLFCLVKLDTCFCRSQKNNQRVCPPSVFPLCQHEQFWIVFGNRVPTPDKTVLRDATIQIQNGRHKRIKPDGKPLDRKLPKQHVLDTV